MTSKSAIARINELEEINRRLKILQEDCLCPGNGINLVSTGRPAEEYFVDLACRLHILRKTLASEIVNATEHENFNRCSETDTE